jgi:hypothetical protein
LLQDNLTCFEVTRFAGARIALTNVTHAVFINGARAFWTNAQCGSASKVNGFSFIVLGVTKIKFQFKAGIGIVFIVFWNFTQLNDGRKWPAYFAPEPL